MTRWSLFPHFIVRTTGFPFELVERLRCSQSAALVHRTLAAQARLEVLRKNAPRIRRPPSAVLAALKANRPVPLEGVEDPSLFNDWNAAAGELVEAETAFEKAFAREQPGALEALKSISSDP